MNELFREAFEPLDQANKTNIKLDTASILRVVEPLQNRQVP
jgi:hypothetical protein